MYVCILNCFIHTHNICKTFSHEGFSGIKFWHIYFQSCCNLYRYFQTKANVILKLEDKRRNISYLYIVCLVSIHRIFPFFYFQAREWDWFAHSKEMIEHVLRLNMRQKIQVKNKNFMQQSNKFIALINDILI